jgi:hypothetical protein
VHIKPNIPYCTRTIYRCGMALCAIMMASLARADDKIDFDRDVRSILSSRCFQCHGPDDQARKAGLRLDKHDSAIKELKSGDIAIVPGKPQQSELLARIVSTDEEDMMPPPKSGARLTAQQTKILRRWIEQGAAYTLHWSYINPARSAPPAVQEKLWPQNDMDRFVLAHLEQQGLHPSPQTDRYTLIRRVSLDLTGLPPTIAQADAFAKDTSPDAYEKLVDRLLASPAYGERWAQVWLDLARYADSQGYANDPERTIWRWRDWLIKAINDNKPYDQFTIEMLAGDMLPNATPEQIIATGFHRNTLVNTEGGTQPEEFRSAAIIDRVNTTMSVWMGSTFACCQCHNHKYDPFTQKEYFQLYAIFNSTEDANRGDDTPTLQVPRYGMEKQAAEMKPEFDANQAEMAKLTKSVDADRDQWEKMVDPKTLPPEIATIFAMEPKTRKKAQKDKLTEYFRSQSPQWKAAEARFKDLQAQYTALTTTTPVMREIAPRETHIQLRGNYLSLGDKVMPGLPATFPGPPAGTAINRLTLARWIANPENPLSARVQVNRLWEELFGVGIVETVEDFGTQGEEPSNQQLLDYLATEFVRLGWDNKALLKEIVCSATYQQSSAVSEDLQARDPNNRLLARGPRVRLAAETIRDEAMFAAGLLSANLYGPPSQPPKPSFGLTAAFGGATDWTADTGPNRYRRGVYIRVRRNAPYPSLTTFDATERTSCTCRRIRTNTPLQALVTLNDPCFIEAAQGLARRAQTCGGGDVATQLDWAFRATLTRPPTAVESRRLVALFNAARAEYAKVPDQALAMATQPLGPLPKGANATDLAAQTVVCNVILNLDEALAKP